MSDPWARPHDESDAQRADAVVEIDLDGPGSTNARPEPTSDAPEPNWRRVIGAATAMGVALGLVIAAVVAWSDGDDEATTPTTIPVDEISTLITTPPTLPPVETTPRATDEGSGAGDATSNRRTITVPTYPLVDDVDELVAEWSDQPVLFDTLDHSLTVAITNDNATMDAPSDAVLEWDATNQRFRITYELTYGTAYMIYDVTTDAVYETVVRSTGTDAWSRRPSNMVFGGDLTAQEYFTQALLGPVRFDNVDRALLVDAQAPIRSVDGTPARRTTYVMPDDDAGLWGGATGGDDVTRWEVYTDASGRVVRIQGLSPMTGSPSLVIHTPTRGEVQIALPDEDDVIDGVDDDENGVLPTNTTAELLRPVYPTVDPVPANSTGQYSIADALDLFVSRPPAAASTYVTSTEDAMRIAALRDDANDRRSMTVDSDQSSVVTVQIDDGASGTSLRADTTDDRWARSPTATAWTPIDERLISGLLEPSTIEQAEVSEPYRFVTLGDGTVALEAHLVLRPGTVDLPEVVPMELDAGKAVHVYLYVGAGAINEIQLLSNRDERLLVQRFDLTAEPEVVLPDPADVDDA